MIPHEYHGLDVLVKLAKFVVVGSTGVIVNSTALFFFYEVAGLHLIVASIAAVELAILNNYVWNNWWTFGRKDFSTLGLAKFNLVSLGGLVITTSTLYGLVAYGGLNYLVANLAGICLATLWNFGANLVWTWGGDG